MNLYRNEKNMMSLTLVYTCDLKVPVLSVLLALEYFPYQIRRKEKRITKTYYYYTILLRIYLSI